MKHYFKYGAGYVNIDTENLFLTNSGNWQETRELEEKSPKTKRQNSFRIGRMNLFLYVVFGVISIVIFKMMASDAPATKLIFGLPVLAYFVNNYFKNELGKRYKIPLTKIQTVERYDNNGLKINFLNSTNEPDFEIIEKVEPKGFEVLTGLSLLEAIHH